METFLHSIYSVMIILLLTAVGYFCGFKHWMGKESKAFISKFLMSFAVPLMCIYSFETNMSHEMIKQSGALMSVTFICCMLGFLLSYVLGKLLKIPHKRLGVFMMMCSLSNSMFIGLPMCTELFGEVSRSYAMIYFCVSTSFTQAVGTSLVRWSGTNSSGFSWALVKRILKLPTIWSVVIGFILVLTDTALPALAMSLFKYMNNLVTPLALLLTGYIIYEIGLKNLSLERDLTVMLLFRFGIAPLTCFLFCTWFGISGLARNVFLIQAAMPVVTQTVVASAEYGADERFAAKGAAISTIACFVVTPVLMLLVS